MGFSTFELSTSDVATLTEGNQKEWSIVHKRDPRLRGVFIDAGVSAEYDSCTFNPKEKP